MVRARRRQFFCLSPSPRNQAFTSAGIRLSDVATTLHGFSRGEAAVARDVLSLPPFPPSSRLTLWVPVRGMGLRNMLVPSPPSSDPHRRACTWSRARACVEGLKRRSARARPPGRVKERSGQARRQARVRASDPEPRATGQEDNVVGKSS